MKYIISLRDKLLYKTWKNEIIIPVDYDFYDMLIFSTDMEEDE